MQAQQKLTIVLLGILDHLGVGGGCKVDFLLPQIALHGGAVLPHLQYVCRVASQGEQAQCKRLFGGEQTYTATALGLTTTDAT